ncbi:MAG TPA: glycosyltransferase [Chryseolinea sp.]|nr:glycosyltransferase [Chryseolinea sp.]
MKVAFVFLHPFSGSLGSTVRVRELAVSLREFGVESYILTPYEKSRTISEGVNVVCIADFLQKLGLSNFIYKLTKDAYYNSFFISKFIANHKVQRFTSRLCEAISNAVKKIDADLVQIEQDIALLSAIDPMKKMDVPFLVDLHNITSEELVAAKVITQESKEFEILQERSCNALQQMDSIVVVNDEMKDYVVKNYGFSMKRVVVVPPGGRVNVKEVYEKSPQPKIVYSGSVAYREHLDLFINSMPIVKKKSSDARFYITKKGRALKKINQLAKELGVNPSYFWFPTENTFYKFLSSCHVGVLPSSQDLARQMGTPVKLFDYLSVGLPVVANNIGAWTNLVKQEKVGVLTEDNPSDFASGILQLIENKEFALECCNNGLDLIRKKYNWQNSAKTLFGEYNRLLNSSCNKNSSILTKQFSRNSIQSCSKTFNGFQ